MNESLLKVENIETYYGPIMAIRGVSFEVKKGSIVTILGSNGAGKTTILKTISGAIDPRKGKILLNGKGGELISIGDYNNLSKKILDHFKKPTRLIGKTMFAQKHLQRFEIRRHSKIYSNIFKKIK